MRWITTTLAVASGLACLLVVGLWAKSHLEPVIPMGVPMREEGGRYVWEGWILLSSRGVVGVGHEYLLEKTEGATDTHTGFEHRWMRELVLVQEPVGPFGPPGWMGFNLFADRGDDEMARWKVWWVTCPHWFLMAVTLVYPGRWVRGWLRRRRSRQWTRRGMCEFCGYDLRESGARCPECGSVRERAGTGDTQ